jgi:DNA-binding response OmpR family regulator
MPPKILVIDDDPDIRRLVQLELTGAGYEVAFAHDAVSAMTVARKEQPAVVVLDIGLPGGDGYLVMERFRQFPALETIPVVVVTARERVEARAKSLAAGARAFLPKPFDPSELRALVDELLPPEA